MRVGDFQTQKNIKQELDDMEWSHQVMLFQLSAK
jgi:hypothetical protein